MTYFVFDFHVVQLAILLMPIIKLYFQISNCHVFVFVTLANVFQVYIVTVLNCNVSYHRVSLKHTLKRTGRAFRSIGKYTSLTLKKKPCPFFRLFVLTFFFADKILYYRIRYFYFVAVALVNTVNCCFLLRKESLENDSARIWKYVCLRKLKMFAQLTENVGKIISAHPKLYMGPKLNKHPTVNRISTVISV